jgi:hypothetical protein
VGPAAAAIFATVDPGGGAHRRRESGAAPFARALLAGRAAFFLVLPVLADFRMSANQLGPLDGQLIPGPRHLEELIALFSLHVLGERAALLRVFSIL